MVSKEEAKKTIAEAHDFANGNPDDRVQEFFLAKEVVDDDDSEGDGENTFLEIAEIPFHSEIHTEISSIFVEELYKLMASVVRKENKPISEYQAGNIERDEVPVQYLPVSDIPNYDIFDPFTRESGFNETSFDSFDSPDFQALRIRDKWGNMFVAFRKFNRRQIVGSSWKVKLALRNSEYDVFEQNLYALPEHIDAFVFNDILFVLNQGKFEDIFDYFSAYEESANTVFKELEKSEFTIHNPDLFEEAVLADRSALRKMVAVEERELYKELDREIVEEVIDEFELGVEVEERDGDWGIVLSGRGDKTDVIRLLNDDHLYSEITDRKYQAQRKKQV